MDHAEELGLWRSLGAVEREVRFLRRTVWQMAVVLAVAVWLWWEPRTLTPAADSPAPAARVECALARW